jgi:hypothetical protein
LTRSPPLPPSDDLRATGPIVLASYKSIASVQVNGPMAKLQVSRRFTDIPEALAPYRRQRAQILRD